MTQEAAVRTRMSDAEVTKYLAHFQKDHDLDAKEFVAV